MAYQPISFEDPVQDRIRQQFRLGQLQQMVGQQPGAAVAPAAPVPAAGAGLARQIVGGLGGIGGWMGGAALASKFIPHPAAQIGIPLLASILAPKMAEGVVDTVAPGMLDSSAGMAVPGAIGLAAYLATRGKAGKVPGASTAVTTPKPALTQVQASVPMAGPVAIPGRARRPTKAEMFLNRKAAASEIPTPAVHENMLEAMASPTITPQEWQAMAMSRRPTKAEMFLNRKAAASEIPTPAVHENMSKNPVIAHALSAQMTRAKKTPTSFMPKNVIEKSFRLRSEMRSRKPAKSRFANKKESILENNAPSIEDEVLAEYMRTLKKK